MFGWLIVCLDVSSFRVCVLVCLVGRVSVGLPASCSGGLFAWLCALFVGLLGWLFVYLFRLVVLFAFLGLCVCWLCLFIARLFGCLVGQSLGSVDW